MADANKTPARYSDSAKLDFFAMHPDNRRGNLKDGTAEILRGGEWRPLWGRLNGGAR